jgi:Zn-dependent protease with chaperone function
MTDWIKRVSDTMLAMHGVYLDGDSPVPRPIELRFDDPGHTLVLHDAGDRSEVARWPLAEIRAMPDQARDDLLILRLAGDTTARIVVDWPETVRNIRLRAIQLDQTPPVSNRARLLGWAAGAVSSVALIILVLVPVMADQLAGFLPPQGEKALGDATLSQIRSALDETGLGELPFCESPAGVAALQKLEATLVARSDLPVELTVHVLDHGMVNAFALPGGHIVFFRGLLEQADTPAEVAAVFAHEMGHVEARDPTRIALRSAGSIGVLGLLFGDFAGGALVLFLTERLIQADYTREAEAAADSYAYALLIRTGQPPSAIATFFERLMAENGDQAGIVQHFLSHPALGDRIAAARAATPKAQKLVPILTDAEWQALLAICDDNGWRAPGLGFRDILDSAQ